MLKLCVFLLYSSFVFPSFICSFLYPLILIVWPLKNEAYSLISWRKNSCLGDGDYEWRLKIMEHLCQRKVSCFFICLGKVLLLYEAENLLSLPMSSLMFPGQNQEHRAHSPNTDSTCPANGLLTSSHQLNPHSSTGPEAWPRQTHQRGGKRNDPQNSGHNAGEEVGWGGQGLQLQLQEEGKGHWIGALTQGSKQTCLVWLSSQSSKPHWSAAQGSRKIK